MAEPRKSNTVEKNTKVEGDAVSEVQVDVKDMDRANPTGSNPTQLSAEESGLDELRDYNRDYLDRLNFLEGKIEVTVFEPSDGHPAGAVITFTHQGRNYHFTPGVPREVPRKVYSMIARMRVGKMSFETRILDDKSTLNRQVERRVPRYPTSYTSLAKTPEERKREEAWLLEIKRSAL